MDRVAGDELRIILVKAETGTVTSLLVLLQRAGLGRSERLAKFTLTASLDALGMSNERLTERI